MERTAHCETIAAPLNAVLPPLTSHSLHTGHPASMPPVISLGLTSYAPLRNRRFSNSPFLGLV